MKPPKLYRKVYVVANEFNDSDYIEGLFLDKVYIKAKLALDEFKNPFWQILNDDENVIDYEFSDFDINNLDCEWSNMGNPENTKYKELNKHNPSKSFNRKSITKWRIDYDDCPF